MPVIVEERDPFEIADYDFNKRQRLLINYKEGQGYGAMNIQANIDVILPSIADGWTDGKNMVYSFPVWAPDNSSTDTGYLNLARNGTTLELSMGGYDTALSDPTSPAEMIYELFDTQLDHDAVYMTLE